MQQSLGIQEGAAEHTCAHRQWQQRCAKGSSNGSHSSPPSRPPKTRRTCVTSCRFSATTRPCSSLLTLERAEACDLASSMSLR